MPRQARKKSKTGIYHILVRGINRQNIFHDDEDKHTYLERLSGCKDTCNFELYAYCLMDNHVHLLLNEKDAGTSEIMKRINAGYVYWHNQKYSRIGHLFQDRYKSEPIEDESYLLTALRYILQNPIKIGLRIDSWTSYNDYTTDNGIIDTQYILSLFGNTPAASRKHFIEYVSTPSEDICLDVSERLRLTDEEAKEIALHHGTNVLQELQQMDKVRRDSILRDLKAKGLTIRQLERITGVNRGVILKA